MASNIKFALYDFSGTTKEFYFVDEVEVPKPVLEPTVSHHVVIVDRSGSMYSAMKDTRAMVEKVMVAEEFTNSELLLTLISYSSKGDFTLHFGRKKVSEVLDPNNGFVDQIRSIQATCLTSVSGALDESLKHIVSGETTAVSIHTDGWFNDASPASEAKLVDKWIKTVQKDFPNVYANTIAYGSWSDFKTLDRISQSLSGKTVIAKTVKQVFDALHDTTALLAGRVLPAIHVPKDDSDFLAVHNVTQKKVNGNTVDFAVKGVGPDDVTKLYRFKKVTQERWEKDKRVEAIGSDATPVYVFARSLLAVGRLNDAKYALCGTGDQTLLRQHYKDLTSEALAGFADDLDKRISGDFDGLVASTSKGLGSSAGSVAELCQVLERHRKDFTLNLTETLKGYKRRSVKRLAGEWVNGTFVPSSTRLVPTDDAGTVSVATFEINNSNATINMQVMRTADLYKDGVHVPTAAGKKLDLREIRAYTIVGDGEVNLPSLTVKISSKKLHAALVEGGWLTGDFDHTKEYTIDLSELAAVPFSQGVKFPPSDTFEHLMMLTVKRGILTACLGGSAKADDWTPEQLEELKANDLSASLNYNPKTTNPYTDLTAAISAGEIDSRTKFNITLGDSRMVSVSSLYSANEYLARRFSVKGSDPAECDKDGNLKKPKFADIINGAAFSVKALSARTKLNAIDDIMMPMFEQFMSAGFDGISRTSHRIDMVEALHTTEEEIEAFYASLIRPVSMYIGSTGLIPEGWQVEVVDGEGLVAKFADIDVAKKQKEEGTFLVNGSLVVGIFPEVAYFSTPKGIEAAKAISAASEE